MNSIQQERTARNGIEGNWRNRDTCDENQGIDENRYSGSQNRWKRQGQWKNWDGQKFQERQGGSRQDYQENWGGDLSRKERNSISPKNQDYEAQEDKENSDVHREQNMKNYHGSNKYRQDHGQEHYGRRNGQGDRQHSHNRRPNYQDMNTQHNQWSRGASQDVDHTQHQERRGGSPKDFWNGEQKKRNQHKWNQVGNRQDRGQGDFENKFNYFQDRKNIGDVSQNRFTKRNHNGSWKKNETGGFNNTEEQFRQKQVFSQIGNQQNSGRDNFNQKATQRFSPINQNDQLVGTENFYQEQFGGGYFGQENYGQGGFGPGFQNDFRKEAEMNPHYSRQVKLVVRFIRHFRCY